jgi:hypothetical protein
MEKKEDAVLGMDIYRLKRMGGREKAGLDPEDVSTGEAMGDTLSGTGTPNPWWGTGPSHRRVLGQAWERWKTMFLAEICILLRETGLGKIQGLA